MSENNKMINWMKIIFSLAKDLLLISFIAFSLVFLAEGVLPGIATSHLPWRYLVLFLISSMFLVIFLGNKIGMEAWKKDVLANKKTASLAVLLLFLAFLGNFWKGTSASFLLAIFSIFTIIFAYRLIKSQD